MSRSLVTAVVAAGLLLEITACRTAKRPEELALPATSSRRAESGVLMDRVDRVNRAPGWLDEERVQGRYLYSVGMVEAQGSPEHDLHRAMIEARASLERWLVDNGARIESERGLVPPLEVELRGMRFDRLAYDERGGMWYSLARLDRKAEARLAKVDWQRLNDQLAFDRGVVEATDQVWEDRVSSALDLLFGLDRRRQHAASYAFFADETLEDPEGLGSADLEGVARDLLMQHSVRVVLDVPPVDGLTERIDGVFGAVYLATHEFGEGLLSVRLKERELFSASAATPYLYLEGEVQTAIPGGGAALRTIPIRVVETGMSLGEARGHAERAALLRIEQILWDALRRDAS